MHIIRTTYFQVDQTPLLHGAVFPTLERLMVSHPQIRPMFRFHWSQGPHIDCAFDVDEEQFQAEVWPTINAAFTEWLRDNPSQRGLGEAFLDQSRRMALAEGWRGPIEPVLGNNMVFVAPYDWPDPVNSKRLANIRNEFLLDTFGTVLKLAKLRAQGRNSLMLQAMRLLAGLGRLRRRGDFDFWPLSMSAHAKLFFLAHPQSEELFETSAGKITKVVHSAVAPICDRDAPIPDDLVEWHLALQKLDLAVMDLLEEEPVLGEGPEIENPLHIFDNPGDAKAKQNAVQDIFGNEALQAAFRTPCHAQYRILLNMIYVALASATLSPSERAFSCFALHSVLAKYKPESIEAAGVRLREMAELANA